MAATLDQIAKRTSVSTATVSRILNNKMPMPISAATIERVRQAARDMNYSPNVAARALVTRRSKTIGLFSSEDLPWIGLSSGSFERNAQHCGAGASRRPSTARVT
jgi:DNA-binding LacI/PurR family transcriptional regulator